MIELSAGDSTPRYRYQAPVGLSTLFPGFEDGSAICQNFKHSQSFSSFFCKNYQLHCYSLDGVVVCENTRKKINYLDTVEEWIETLCGLIPYECDLSIPLIMRWRLFRHLLNLHWFSNLFLPLEDERNDTVHLWDWAFAASSFLFLELCQRSSGKEVSSVPAGWLNKGEIHGVQDDSHLQLSDLWGHRGLSN